MITSDNTYEDRESFRVAVDSMSLHTWVSRGSFAEATITITDESCKF